MFARLIAGSKKSLKSSTTVIRQSPSDNKRSTRCEPMNPAPPVIRMFFILECAGLTAQGVRTGSGSDRIKCYAGGSHDPVATAPVSDTINLKRARLRHYFVA